MTEKSGLEPKILTVSDQNENDPFRDLKLHQQPINVVIETNLLRTFEYFERESPDLLILDINLNKDMLIELIESLRPKMYIPIILLTSLNSDSFTIDAYKAGVDDYILKPVSPELLKAKLSVWLRHSWGAGPGMLDPLKINQLRLLPSEKMIMLGDDHTVRLTNLELRLLYNLMRRAGHAVTNEELTEKIWGYSGETDNTLIKNVVYRLRHKIEVDPAAPSIIQTVPGIGYRLSTE